MATRFCIGVDVGGTKVAAALVSEAGDVSGPITVPTPAAQGADAILDAIASAAGQVRSEIPADTRLVGVGVATGGVVDHSRGTIVSANVLLAGWAGTNVGARLTQRLGLAVAVDNDVNGLALGEQSFGAGQGLSEVLYVAAGTGIGGALVVAGQLVRGAHHTAGELGHLPVPGAEGRRCNCGKYGHLEAAAAGPAISEHYRQTTGDQSPVDLRIVAQRAESGDAVARDALASGAAILGRALGGLVNTIDPQAVVIGGGVVEVGQLYWGPLTAALRAELLPGPGSVSLRRARLGPHAAVVGAAALIFGDVGSDRSD